MAEDEMKMLFRDLYGRRRGPQTFRLGDPVRVLDGPFAAFTDDIEGINQARRLLKVRVEIFGRTVPIKVGFADAEKVSFS
jgi:transcription termination/antitermination protein NusG